MQANIVLLPGDGIGPEVVAAAVRVLHAIEAKFGHQVHIFRTPDRRLFN